MEMDTYIQLLERAKRDPACEEKPLQRAIVDAAVATYAPLIEQHKLPYTPMRGDEGMVHFAQKDEGIASLCWFLDVADVPDVPVMAEITLPAAPQIPHTNMLDYLKQQAAQLPRLQQFSQAARIYEQVTSGHPDLIYRGLQAARNAERDELHDNGEIVIGFDLSEPRTLDDVLSYLKAFSGQ